MSEEIKEIELIDDEATTEETPVMDETSEVTEEETPAMDTASEEEEEVVA